MIPAILYYDVYLLVVTVLTLFLYHKYKKLDSKLGNIQVENKFFIFLLVVCFVLFIGLRPTSYHFIDMMSYQMMYNLNEGFPFEFDLLAENFLFDNLLAFWSSARLGFNSFMLLMCAINFGCTYWACRRMFPNDTTAAFLVFLGAFSTFSYATNGVKAGVAAAVFILALSYYRKWIIFIALLLVSYGLHHSMVLPISACILALFCRNTKLYMFVWVLCVLMSAAHVTFFQDLFGNIMADSLNDVRGASYLQSVDKDWGGNSGFRYDFILYSSMPILVGYYAIIKKKLQVSRYYTYILNIYLIINSIWMLCMYAAFTNRIAYLSWLMYPIVLIYPYLCEDWGERRYRSFAKIMLAHLGFTLAMHFIYYA